MSALVVSDVLSAATGTSVVASMGQTIEEDSSITPFKTILKQVSTNSTDDMTSVSGSKGTEVVKNVTTEGSGGGSVKYTTKLDNIFKKASEKYDISYDFLVAVAKAESDFRFDCVSSAGARGIMQLMPDEIKDMNVTDAFDPEQNIMAAARLLKAHLKKFNGDYTLAAAAYNAGSGAVNKYGGVPPYTETQNYVKKINKYMSEGVKVPDKDVDVSQDYSSYDGTKPKVTSDTSSDDVTKSDIVTTTSSETAFDEGVMATDEDWDKVRITVGTGDQAVTMTYGAYQKYKELGSLGVG